MVQRKLVEIGASAADDEFLLDLTLLLLSKAPRWHHSSPEAAQSHRNCLCSLESVALPGSRPSGLACCRLLRLPPWLRLDVFLGVIGQGFPQDTFRKELGSYLGEHTQAWPTPRCASTHIAQPHIAGCGGTEGGTDSRVCCRADGDRRCLGGRVSRHGSGICCGSRTACRGAARCV